VVFLKQLTSWLLHGSLHDQYSEFFITRAVQSAPSSTDTDRSANDDFDAGGITGSQLNIIMASTVTLLYFFVTVS